MMSIFTDLYPYIPKLIIQSKYSMKKKFQKFNKGYILLWKNLGKLRKMLRRVTRCDLFSLGYVLFAWEEHMQLLKTFGGKGQLISE